MFIAWLGSCFGTYDQGNIMPSDSFEKRTGLIALNVGDVDGACIDAEMRAPCGSGTGDIRDLMPGRWHPGDVNKTVTYESEVCIAFY